MSQAGITSVTDHILPPDVATRYVTDSGTAIPSGNVLNVNGAPGVVVSANPDLSNNILITASGSSPPSPAKVLTLVDDFLSNATGGNSVGNLLWQSTNSNLGSGSINHPGFVNFPTTPGFFSFIYLITAIGGNDTGSFALGGGAFSLNFVAKLNALSTNANTYTINIGLADCTSDAPSFPAINGVYFTYTNSINSGNWQIVTVSSSVFTTTNTSVAADTGYHNFGISINAAATSISYTIDGVSVGTITTHIPTGLISPMIYHNPTAGTPAAFDIDLFYATLTLTTSR